MDGCYRNGDTVLHILAKQNENADIIKRFLNGLESFNPQCRIDALDKRNRRGETSYSVARSDGVRKFLWWSEYQDGFYYLSTPPVVLVMYSTTGRPYFDGEIRQLLDVLKSELKVDPILPHPDLSKEEILSEINSIEADRHHQASALIVFYNPILYTHCLVTTKSYAKFLPITPAGYNKKKGRKRTPLHPSPYITTILPPS